jgi:hypothetical protein
VGQFVLAAAMAEPDLDFVGIEHRHHLVDIARMATRRLGVPNANFLAYRAARTSQRLRAPTSPRPPLDLHARSFLATGRWFFATMPAPFALPRGEAGSASAGAPLFPTRVKPAAASQHRMSSVRSHE